MQNSVFIFQICRQRLFVKTLCVHNIHCVNIWIWTRWLKHSKTLSVKHEVKMICSVTQDNLMGSYISWFLQWCACSPPTSVIISTQASPLGRSWGHARQDLVTSPHPRPSTHSIHNFSHQCKEEEEEVEKKGPLGKKNSPINPNYPERAFQWGL